MEGINGSLNFYKNWAVNNISLIATVASSAYIFKSIYDLYSNYKSNNLLYNKIVSIVRSELKNRKNIESKIRKKPAPSKLSTEGIHAYFIPRPQLEKHERNIKNMKNIEIISNKSGDSNNEVLVNDDKKDIEFFLYIYYKVLRTIYCDEFKSFASKRRIIAKENNILKYINSNDNFNNSMIHNEEEVSKIVFNELGITDDKMNEEINFTHISDMYYGNLEREVTKLNLEKANEIISSLFEQTKENISKLVNIMGNETLSEAEYLIAEQLSFDNIYNKYGIDEEELRKYIVENNIEFELKKSI